MKKKNIYICNSEKALVSEHKIHEGTYEISNFDIIKKGIYDILRTYSHNACLGCAEDIHPI